MPGGSLLMLLDDIASILDDVAVMTKKAASKTAGVLGDDLALNAQQVSGVLSRRELPVVWSVAKGSFVNKLILIPAALALNAFAPWAVLPLLMLGGAYLCFEGVEKLVHLRHKKSLETGHDAAGAIHTEPGDEKSKIRGAVRTDFVLSAEIIVITLGVVAVKPFFTQALVLSAIGLVMTVGVYGLVACIVKIDDLGLHLSGRGGVLAVLGRALLVSAPWLMRLLSVAGTAAMFLVGGQILVHGIPPVHHWIEHAVAGRSGALKSLIPYLFNGAFGIVAGALVLVLVQPLMKLRRNHA
jgi:hypothetical protein